MALRMRDEASGDECGMFYMDSAFKRVSGGTFESQRMIQGAEREVANAAICLSSSTFAPTMPMPLYE